MGLPATARRAGGDFSYSSDTGRVGARSRRALSQGARHADPTNRRGRSPRARSCFGSGGVSRRRRRNQEHSTSGSATRTRLPARRSEQLRRTNGVIEARGQHQEYRPTRDGDYRGDQRDCPATTAATTRRSGHNRGYGATIGATTTRRLRWDGNNSASPGDRSAATATAAARPEPHWYRGDRLPPEYRSRSLRRRRLALRTACTRRRAATSGCRPGGDYVLVAVATGIIASILLNQ